MSSMWLLESPTNIIPSCLRVMEERHSENSAKKLLFGFEGGKLNYSRWGYES